MPAGKQVAIAVPTRVIVDEQLRSAATFIQNEKNRHQPPKIQKGPRIICATLFCFSVRPEIRSALQPNQTPSEVGNLNVPTSIVKTNFSRPHAA
jgi:hypothetical protein